MNLLPTLMQLVTLAAVGVGSYTLAANPAEPFFGWLFIVGGIAFHVVQTASHEQRISQLEDNVRRLRERLPAPNRWAA